MNLYNTRTRSLEQFAPQEPGKVKLYTCGPTVYDYLHVGNWTAYIRWDILVRILRNDGYDVSRVMNITDVGHLVSDADEGEDKLEKGARREGKTAWEIAQRYTDDFFKGMHDLNLLPADITPKATEHISDQIELIEGLESKGYTYRISDGIYFDVSKFDYYADFAGLDLAGQQSGTRIGINAEKRNPADFALWKFTPEGQKRDMEWDSPWGRGFPGWHIECSAIALKFLGKTLDIHTGGIDHIPIHHTNEIAQSEAYSGKRFANFWLHNNFLLVDGTKISKSLSNGITLDDIRSKGFDPMDFKLLVLQSHYRSESNFSWENMEAARSRRQALLALADLRWQVNETDDDTAVDFAKPFQTIKQALKDDMNTPQALAALSQLADSINTLSRTRLDEFNSFLNSLEELFGLRLNSGNDISEQQKALLNEREAARQTQDWPKADALRAELEKQRLGVNDTKNGPVWYRILK